MIYSTWALSWCHHPISSCLATELELAVTYRYDILMPYPFSYEGGGDRQVVHCRSTFIVGWHGVGSAIGKYHTTVVTQKFAKSTILLLQWTHIWGILHGAKTNISQLFLHTISHFMSWLNYKDSMLDSLSLGDAFPPIVMLLWQKGSTRRGQVWIQCKGTHFLPEESERDH